MAVFILEYFAFYSVTSTNEVIKVYVKFMFVLVIFFVMMMIVFVFLVVFLLVIVYWMFLCVKFRWNFSRRYEYFIFVVVDENKAVR